MTIGAAILVFAAFIATVAPSDSGAILRRSPRRPAPDSIYFPDAFVGLPATRKPVAEPEVSKQIPLELIMRLNEVQNISELFRDFVKTNPEQFGLDAEIPLANRFGELERKSVTMPKPAGCTPEMHSVSLIPESSTDPTLFYYPTCTRVERCGGCCSHDLLGCQPTITETISFQVVVTQYGGMNDLRYLRKEIVPIEQHLKCKCDCIVKKEDCNQFQEYRDKECRCVCVNIDDEMKCNSENDTKLWDTKECTCRCREVKECSTGYYHDEKTCSCLAVPITRRRASERFGGQYDRKRDQIGRFDYKTARGVVPLPTDNAPTKTR